MMALKEHYAGKVEIIVADLEDPETRRLAEDYPVYYIPAFYFIDSRGRVVSEEAGHFSFEEMVLLVEPILPETAAPSGEEISGLEFFFAETLPGAVGSRSLFTLFLVFFGGLVTSISPCILSMVPLLVSYIGGYGERRRWKGFVLSLFFVTGMALTFALLGFVAAGFGRVFGQVSLVWYYVLAAVAIVMGLQLLGIFNLNLPGLKKIPLRKAGLGGVLVMGMLFGLVASPCATPVLAVIITYAAVQAEPLYGSGLLFVYAMGHGIPLLAAGTFTGIAGSMPRMSRYTQYLSYASGVVLVILGLVLLAWVGRF